MLHIVHTFLLFFISQVYVIMHAPMAVSFNLFFLSFFSLTGLTQVCNFVHLKPARQFRLQDGIENYETPLLYEEELLHPCKVTNVFFVLAVNYHSFLLLSSYSSTTSYILHAVEVMFHCSVFPCFSPKFILFYLWTRSLGLTTLSHQKDTYNKFKRNINRR